MPIFKLNKGEILNEDSAQKLENSLKTLTAECYISEDMKRALEKEKYYRDMSEQYEAKERERLKNRSDALTSNLKSASLLNEEFLKQANDNRHYEIKEAVSEALKQNPPQRISVIGCKIGDNATFLQAYGDAHIENKLPHKNENIFTKIKDSCKALYHFVLAIKKLFCG